jgi:oxygen-independent coproporphyrinogen-3 oxidase
MVSEFETLIQKYGKPEPRYTSYPPVPFWRDAPSDESWIKHLQATYETSDGIDLYVHVPFCESLCFYCGCNRTITKDHGVEPNFVDLILKEWDLYRERLGIEPRVNSIHFGGGTPTFLAPENLRRLIEQLTKDRTPGFIGSIEIDPRTCQKEHLLVLRELGIKRVSLGIQDFDPTVQAAIHRPQSEKLVKGLVAELRCLGFDSINFDLIYGLPKQSLETAAQTIETVSELNPDLIAFYGYAHLPERIKNQKLIKDEDLPSARLRQKLYETGKSILVSAGFEEVGLDHFARAGSYLFEAKKTKILHRNFMGYVDKKSKILLGLGPTSISDSSMSFAQNEKDLKDYEAALSRGDLPIAHGHTHTAEDLLAQNLILKLMCEGEIEVDVDSLASGPEIRRELEEFQRDGIVSVEAGLIRLTKVGQTFMRNVAMSFDHHLRSRSTQAKFSQTI